MYFPNTRHRTVWLDKKLKSRVSEDPSTDNKETGSRHCSNLNDGTFKKFINHCKTSCIEKGLFDGYTKI